MSKKDLSYYLGLDYDIKIKRESLDGEVWYIAYATELGKMACYGRGETPQEAIESFLNEKEDFINYCLESRQAIPEPVKSEEDLEILSGTFNVRTSPQIHTYLANLAKNKGISLNLYVNQILSAASSLDAAEEKFANQLKALQIQLAEHHFYVTGRLKYKVSEDFKESKMSEYMALQFINTKNDL